MSPLQWNLLRLSVLRGDTKGAATLMMGMPEGDKQWLQSFYAKDLARLNASLTGPDAQEAAKAKYAKSIAEGTGSGKIASGETVTPEEQAKIDAQKSATIGATTQIQNEQLAHRNSLQEAAASLERLRIAAESPVGGKFIDAITELAPIVEAIKPGWQNAEAQRLQAEGVQGSELKKMLGQNAAAFIQGNTAFHRGGPWVKAIAEGSNPQVGQTPAQRNMLIKDIADQIQIAIDGHKQMLGVSARDPDLDTLNQSYLNRLIPQIESAQKRISTAYEKTTVPVLQKGGVAQSGTQPGAESGTEVHFQINPTTGKLEQVGG